MELRQTAALGDVSMNPPFDSGPFAKSAETSHANSRLRSAFSHAARPYFFPPVYAARGIARTPARFCAASGVRPLSYVASQLRSSPGEEKTTPRK
jgi:hypothetical protein